MCAPYGVVLLELSDKQFIFMYMRFGGDTPVCVHV